VIIREESVGNKSIATYPVPTEMNKKMLQMLKVKDKTMDRAKTMDIRKRKMINT